MDEKSIFDQRLKRFTPDIVAVVILAALLALFYWDYLIGRSFMWDDTMTEFYPGVDYFAKSVQVGRFPLWFPGVRNGIPFYSDLQMAIFYPPQWFLIPFVKDGRLPFVVYQRYIIFHYFCGGLFAYLFLKQLKLSPLAALSGAMAFCFSGFASLRIVNSVMLQVYAYLPLQLLCVQRFIQSGNWRWWLALVGAMLLSLMAGYPQMTLYCWYLLSAYWLYQSYRNQKGDGSKKEGIVYQLIRRELPRQIVTYAIVFGLGAIMLLPAIENWRSTARPKLSFLEISDPSLPYDQLLTLFVPNFFGTTQSPGSTPPAAFWGFDPHSPNVLRNRPLNAEPGYWQYWEFGAYSGQIFWLAVLLILINWSRVTDKKSVLFFLAIWAFAIWFMLGRYGGLFKLAYHLVPGVAMFRGATKMSCVATFAAAVLIAYAVNLAQKLEGRSRVWPLVMPTALYAALLLALCLGGHHLADGLRHPKTLLWTRTETLYALVATVLCAVAFFSAARMRSQRLKDICLAGLVVLSFADLRHAYGGFHSGGVNPNEYFPEDNRLLSMLKEYREQRGPFRFGQIVRGKVGEEIATFRNLPYFHEFLEVPEGYTSFFLDSTSGFQGITNEEAKISIQNMRVTMERDERGKDWLGTRTNSFPRVKFFSKIRQFDSPEALRRGLEQNEFDWRNEVGVCVNTGIATGKPDENSQHPNTNDAVQVESISPESYSVSYNVSRPGIIFVSQTFYPGWIANDGRVKLVEVFGAFQGLVIPEAGSGQILVRFSPPVFKWSIAITLISLVMTAVVVVIARRNVLPSYCHPVRN